MINFYKVLEVSQHSSKDEIKKAYRTLTKKHHPDKNEGSKEAEERIKLIIEAYKTLIDDNKRLLHDDQIRLMEEQLNKSKNVTNNSTSYRTTLQNTDKFVENIVSIILLIASAFLIFFIIDKATKKPNA